MIRPGRPQPPNGNLCRSDCTFCGDQIVQANHGEQCDDGNSNDGCPTSKDNCTNTCLFPICHDPAAILFWSEPQLDEFRMRATIKAEPEELNDPSTSTITLTIENADGVVYSTSLAPGDLAHSGSSLSSFAMMNPNARTEGGIASVLIRKRMQGPSVISVRSFGDFSAATLSHMKTTVTIGDQVFSNWGDWRKMSNGWFAGHFTRLH